MESFRDFVRRPGESLVDEGWITLNDLPELRESLPDWLDAIRFSFKTLLPNQRDMLVVYTFAAIFGMPKRPNIFEINDAAVSEISGWLKRVNQAAEIDLKIADENLKMVDPLTLSEITSSISLAYSKSKIPAAVSRVAPYLAWSHFFHTLFTSVAHFLMEDTTMYALVNNDSKETHILVLDTTPERVAQRRQWFNRVRQFDDDKTATTTEMISAVTVRSGTSLFPIDWGPPGTGTNGIKWRKFGATTDNPLPPSYAVFIPSDDVKSVYMVDSIIKRNGTVWEITNRLALPFYPIGLPSTFIDVPLAQTSTAKTACVDENIDMFWENFVKAIHEWQDTLQVGNRASVCPPPSLAIEPSLRPEPTKTIEPSLRPEPTKTNIERLRSFVKSFNPFLSKKPLADDGIDQMTIMYGWWMKAKATIVAFGPFWKRQFKLSPAVWNKIISDPDMKRAIEWLEDPARNPPPTNIAKYLARCRDTEYRFFIFHVAGVEISAAHANSVIVDRRSRTIEWFEPHGSLIDPIFSFLQPTVLRALSTLFPGYTTQGALETCPPYGPQALEPAAETGGYCYCWALMFQALRLLNPEWTSRAIINQMTRGGSANYRGELIGLKVFNTAYDLAPRFELNPKILAFYVRSYVTRFAKAAELIAQHYKSQVQQFTLVARGKIPIPPKPLVRPPVVPIAPIAPTIASFVIGAPVVSMDIKQPKTPSTVPIAAISTVPISTDSKVAGNQFTNLPIHRRFPTRYFQPKIYPIIARGYNRRSIPLEKN